MEQKFSYGDIQKYKETFSLKVLQECSSWASSNYAVQMFFLTPNRARLAGKFLK